MFDFYSNVLIDLLSGENVISAALFVSATILFNVSMKPNTIRINENER